MNRQQNQLAYRKLNLSLVDGWQIVRNLYALYNKAADQTNQLYRLSQVSRFYGKSIVFNSFKQTTIAKFINDIP